MHYFEEKKKPVHKDFITHLGRFFFKSNPFVRSKWVLETETNKFPIRTLTPQIWDRNTNTKDSPMIFLIIANLLI